MSIVVRDGNNVLQVVNTLPIGDTPAANSVSMTIAEDDVVFEGLQASLDIIATQSSNTSPAFVSAITYTSTQIPTTSTSSYTAGDCVGSKMTFPNFSRLNGGTGLLQMASVNCKTVQSFNADLVVFHADPTNSTFTDNAAVSVHANDFDKVSAVIPFASASWTNLGTVSFAEATALAMPYQANTGANTLYAVLVTRSAMTLGSTSDIKVSLKGILD